MPITDEHPPVPASGDWVRVTALGPDSGDLVILDTSYKVLRVLDTSHGKPEILVEAPGLVAAGDRQVILQSRHGDAWVISSVPPAAGEVFQFPNTSSRDEHPSAQPVGDHRSDLVEPTKVWLTLTDEQLDSLRSIGLLRFGRTRIDNDGDALETLVLQVFARGMVEVEGGMRSAAVTMLSAVDTSF